MIIINAKLEDLDSIANLHFINFDKNELSVQLGVKFIKELYRLCIVNDKVSVLILKKEMK